MLYKGGMVVESGTYWNLETAERIDADGAVTLSGGTDTKYIKAHVLVAIMAGPVLGLVYALFLPFIGIVMTFSMLWEKIAEVAMDMAASSVSFGWRPIEAYLMGRKKKKEERKNKAEKKQ